MARAHCHRCDICWIAIIFNYIVIGSIAQECDKQLVQQDGTTLCYNLVFAGETWSVATRQCQSRGGSLAVITSDQQNQAVSRLLQDYGRSETWLAANETVHAWQWLDGSDVSYQGCYKDEVQSRDLDEKIQMTGTNSPQGCRAECASRNYTYAGLQNGDECWCGNEFGQHGQQNVNCHINCPSLHSATCGGRNASDIYAVSGVYSNWSYAQPYNPTGQVNCAVMQVNDDNIEWVDYACSRSDISALCDLGPATANECSSRTSSFIIADRCIDVIDDVTTYFKARDLCWKRGPAADLVQLKTEMDNEQAAAALRAYVNSTQSQLPSRFWIGLVRTRWQWASGVKMTFTNWAENTPTSTSLTAGQQCAILSRNDGGRWKNVPCNSRKSFVCEQVISTRSTTTTFRTTTTTTTTTTKSQGRNTSPASLSSTLLYSDGSTTSFDRISHSTPTRATLASNMPFSTEVLIAIVCGAVVFVIIIIVLITVVIVLCRRKHGKAACCCGQSDPEDTSSSEDDTVASPTDLKPHYYFGVTVKDLQDADDVENTSPRPDVVPQCEFNTATNDATSPVSSTHMSAV